MFGGCFSPVLLFFPYTDSIAVFYILFSNAMKLNVSVIQSYFLCTLSCSLFFSLLSWLLFSVCVYAVHCTRTGIFITQHFSSLQHFYLVYWIVTVLTLNDDVVVVVLLPSLAMHFSNSLKRSIHNVRGQSYWNQTLNNNCSLCFFFLVFIVFSGQTCKALSFFGSPVLLRWNVKW